ncbi:MAG: phosphoribosylaminoimidazole-succinocarboxamide synthase [Actinomycetota bacterium]|jgi:phosphoribosylaminoimidazole-succinocarboxamide synthase|nr:phosphoribosylaminoimidazole-succinocarboxamide synthase [Actinomycetota bacterium]MEA2567165.1 phosphoribosylaminoimidazole-succinocarboxamide synthase [Actinomycetota bacterium]
MSQTTAVSTVEVDLPHLSSGKVRELFDLGGDGLLFVASDRISAYDVVMPQAIPDKGRLLTGMSIFWFGATSDICPNHFLSAASNELPRAVREQVEALQGRHMVVRKLDMLPVEFVVRGYLVGSGWKDYRRTGAVCGIPLPEGLVEADKLPEPIFTPATKATVGHDENISEAQAAELCPPGTLKVARDYAVELYKRAAGYARGRGIIIADTKFEFGLAPDGEVTLADEVLTPDSSRFWPADQWEPGANPPSLDKQYLRDWLDVQGWDHKPPAPDLPPDVVERTRAGYVEAYERLTGRTFS